MLNQLHLQADLGQFTAKEDPASRAVNLYYAARARATAKRLAAAFKGKPRRMLHLSDLSAGRTSHTSHSLGLREVPLDQIRGSEGRAGGFDAEMWPTDGQSRDRWVSIAVARERGVALPPVELIQVGDTYFVRDGHHRISVARALGQAYIDAEVTAWQVSRPKRVDVGPLAQELALQPA